MLLTSLEKAYLPSRSPSVRLGGGHRKGPGPFGSWAFSTEARRLLKRDASQAAWWQVAQLQSSQVQEEQESEQCSQLQVLWLQVGQLQSVHSHTAQESEQCSQEQVSHSS